MSKSVATVTARRPRILLMDIETNSINAPFGITLCMGYQDLYTDAKPKVVSVLDFKTEHRKDPTNEVPLLKKCWEILSNADYLVTWFGQYFDERFLRSKMLYYNLGPLPPILDIDGWFTSRYQLALHSNRLEAVQDFLELNVHKTKIDYAAWRRAPSGHIPSLKTIITHCYKDISVLKAAYLRLRPYMKAHPNINVLTGQQHACATCGSAKIQRRGVMVTKERAYQRFQCQSCGSWLRGERVNVEAKGQS